MARADAAVAQTHTVAAARRELAIAFRAGGIETPDLDARILIGHMLGLDHAGLVAADRRLLTIGEESAIAALGQRRLNHEPAARILGQKEFWSLPLRLNEATLVPRPETETVVEAALAAIDSSGSRTDKLRIADLGTGSGALALALLSELPNAFAVGTDLSFGALTSARDNAQRLGFLRAAFVACTMADALRGPFDVVVSNPPYIASDEIAALAPEVRNFDPRLALDGGRDGLDGYREIAATIQRILAPGGYLVVELGIRQAEPAAALFAAAGLAPLPPRADLSGVPRALVAEKRRESGMSMGHWTPAKKHLE
jgi:release factor glutamine methyltransferase